MIWFVLDAVLAFAATNAVYLRYKESEHNIKKEYNLRQKRLYPKLSTKILKFILGFLGGFALLLTPGLNIAVLFLACSNNKKIIDFFRKMAKRKLGRYNILEKKASATVSKKDKSNTIDKTDKPLGKEEPKTSKKMIDDLSAKVEETAKEEPKSKTNKELLDDLRTKVEETPKEEPTKTKSKELLDDLSAKVNETPKEEPKPFIRTALQPEGQLPFEIVWEGSVYSGTSRTLKR